MTIRSQVVKVTTEGGDGVAVGSARVQFEGKILSVQMTPNSDLPSTTDTTIRITATGDSPTNIEDVAVFGNKGDTEGIQKVYPKTQAVDGSGSNVPAGDNAFTEFITTSGIEVDVAQADALTDAVVVEVFYEI